MDDPTEQTTDAGVTEDTPPSVSNEGGGRARGIVAGVLGVLAVVLLTITAVAVWARVTVFSSPKVAAIVGDALAEPEVQQALSTYLTDQAFLLIDVESVLDQVLPTPLQRLEPVLAAGARTAVDRALNRLLSNPEVQQVMTTVVERAHSRAMDLLEGDGLVDGINVSDGKITVNLLPLVGRGVEQLQQLGLFGDLQMPELTADGDPDEQIAALEKATGRDLQPDFGQLVVYQSEQVADAQAALQTAQRVFALAKRAVWLMVGVTILLIAATVLVARNRWLATLLLGLGAVGAMVITRAVTRRVVDEAPLLAARPGGQAAIGAIVSGAATGLMRLAAVLAILAVLAVVIALFRRHWRRPDLILVGAVVFGVAVVVVLGVTIGSLLLGIAVAVAAVLVGRHFLLTDRSTPVAA